MSAPATHNIAPSFHPFSKAVWDNDVLQALEMLESNPSLALLKEPECGHTVLSIACNLVNGEKLVEKLCDYQADIGVYCKHANGPLREASRSGAFFSTKLLLKLGAEVNKRTHKGDTPLFNAAESGHTDIVKLLLQHNADIHIPMWDYSTPLYIACQSGHFEVVKFLLENGAKDDINKPTYDKSYPLHAATDGGHLDVIKLLCEANAIVDAKMQGNSFTSLFLACRRGHYDCVKYLISQGADVNAVSSVNSTSLLIAAEHNNLEILKYLISVGADYLLTMDGGFSAFYFACQNGHLEIAKYLASLPGVTIDQVTTKNYSPLSIAIEKAHFPVVNWLLTQQPDLTTITIYSDTILDIAKETGDNKIIQAVDFAYQKHLVALRRFHSTKKAR